MLYESFDIAHNIARSIYRYSYHNHLVYFPHELFCELKGGDDLFVVYDVLGRESELLAVFEPLLEWLIAADVLFPLCLRDVS